MNTKEQIDHGLRLARECAGKYANEANWRALRAHLERMTQTIPSGAWATDAAKQSVRANGLGLGERRQDQDEDREMNDADNRPAVAGQVEPTVRPHVGDSNFESWFEYFVHSGKGTKQAMKEAYAAGLDEGFNGQLVAAALEVVRHMNGRMPVRGWLNDTGDSRKALDELAKVLGA
jgi:hypothetical protein